MTPVTNRKLVTAVRHELECLWYDLFLAQRHAVNGEWSVGCDSIEARIKDLTPLVGHTNWQKVQVALLLNGVYQRIHRDLGIRVRPDMAQVREIEERRNRR